jgi:uncharacterized protein (DUF302 family)
MVRRALTQVGLHAASEFDVASRIKKELGAGVAPCTVLFVDDPALLLESVVFDRGAALGIPQRVVVSGRSRGTEVQVRSAASLTSGLLPGGAQAPLLQLHRRIVEALEMVAERDGASFANNTLEFCSTHSKGDLICKRNTLP